MQAIRPFEPTSKGTFYIANALAASALAALPENSNVVALYNSSDTATAFWHCAAAGSTAVAALPTAGSTSPVGAMPIPPSTFVRVSVPFGVKSFSVISDIAHGNLFITPGIGN